MCLIDHKDKGLKTKIIATTTLFASIATALFATHAVAGEFKFSAGVEADIIEQQIEVDENNRSIGASNQIIRPFLRAAYEVETLEGPLRVNQITSAGS